MRQLHTFIKAKDIEVGDMIKVGMHDRYVHVVIAEKGNTMVHIGMHKDDNTRMALRWPNESMVELV